MKFELSATNESDPLRILLESYRRGNLSREIFWQGLNEQLRLFANLAELIRGKIKSIQVSQQGVILEYYVTPSNVIKLLVPLDDLRTASLTILANGVYEPFLEDVIFALAEESDVFYDIGANLGFYTNGVVARNADTKCYAFEPNPQIADFLNKNVNLNEFTSFVQIFNIALDDHKGEMEFFIPLLTGSGGGSFRNLHPEEGPAKSIVVSCARLDDLSGDLRLPSLVKIDVEGAELGVLRGSLRTLRESHPTIVIELLRKWMKSFGVTPQDVVNLLRSEGYECFGIQQDGLRTIKNINLDTLETNFLFLHPARPKHRDKLNLFIHD